jgi:type I restriction enzyme M protein
MPRIPFPTTTQSPDSLLKSARDIVRKDKGLNGELGRLPLLTWVMFLKFIDDLEIRGGKESKLSGKRIKPALKRTCRRRNWAVQTPRSSGFTALKMRVLFA